MQINIKNLSNTIQKITKNIKPHTWHRTRASFFPFPIPSNCVHQFASQIRKHSLLLSLSPMKWPRHHLTNCRYLGRWKVLSSSIFGMQKAMKMRSGDSKNLQKRDKSSCVSSLEHVALYGLKTRSSGVKCCQTLRNEIETRHEVLCVRVVCLPLVIYYSTHRWHRYSWYSTLNKHRRTNDIAKKFWKTDAISDDIGKLQKHDMIGNSRNQQWHETTQHQKPKQHNPENHKKHQTTHMT